MKSLITIALLLVIILVSLSAYIRLAHSGIGCPDWPQCYGRVGQIEAVDETTDSQQSYQNMVDNANQPLAWATPLHRLVASTLGLIIVLLTIIALRLKRNRIISLSLLGLTVYLALLGIRSGHLYDPAVIMGNLVGGFVMLGLLAWLKFSFTSPESRHVNFSSTPSAPILTRWAIAALIVLSLQILIGGLTSANFAATACQTFPDCQGSWLPDKHLISAFDLSRQHPINEEIIVIDGAQQKAIHTLHRLGAMASLLLLLFVGMAAVRHSKKYVVVGYTVILLICLEFTIGVLAVTNALPISLAVLHNWLAALLVIALLWLLSLSTGTKT